MALFDSWLGGNRSKASEATPPELETYADIERYIRGALRLVRTDDGLIQPYRFTAQQMEILTHIGRDRRAIATSGVVIDFLTTGNTIAFDCKITSGLDRMHNVFETVMQHEGVLGSAEDGIIDGIDVVAGGARSYTTTVADGTIRLDFENPHNDPVEVRVFLPYIMSVAVGNLRANGNIEPAPDRGYLLALGDSITQGFVVGCPSLTYPAQVATTLGLDLVNQGIAGHVFDRRTLRGIDDLRANPPRVITVAYGTNDWSRKDNARAIQRGAERYLSRLMRSFPDVPIYVISPLWRADEQDPVPSSVALTWVGDMLANLCDQRDVLHFIDGYHAIPKNAVMLADGRLHPGSVDAGLVADAISSAITADGVIADAGTVRVIPKVEGEDAGAAVAAADAESAADQGETTDGEAPHEDVASDASGGDEAEASNDAAATTADDAAAETDDTPSQPTASSAVVDTASDAAGDARDAVGRTDVARAAADMPAGDEQIGAAAYDTPTIGHNLAGGQSGFGGSATNGYGPEPADVLMVGQGGVAARDNRSLWPGGHGSMSDYGRVSTDAAHRPAIDVRDGSDAVATPASVADLRHVNFVAPTPAAAPRTSSGTEVANNDVADTMTQPNAGGAAVDATASQVAAANASGVVPAQAANRRVAAARAGSRRTPNADAVPAGRDASVVTGAKRSGSDVVDGSDATANGAASRQAGQSEGVRPFGLSPTAATIMVESVALMNNRIARGNIDLAQGQITAAAYAARGVSDAGGAPAEIATAADVAARVLKAVVKGIISIEELAARVPGSAPGMATDGEWDEFDVAETWDELPEVKAERGKIAVTGQEAPNWNSLDEASDWLGIHAIAAAMDASEGGSSASADVRGAATTTSHVTAIWDDDDDDDDDDDIDEGGLEALNADEATRKRAGAPGGHPAFDRLVRTIWRLRQSDGCPWDREQTHESITRNMVSEAYEAVDAINEGDLDHLVEELGDVLEQVLLHAQIASDAGEFTIDDVCRALNEKLVRRHPHVFGDRVARTADDALRLWDEMKQEERIARGELGVRERPRGLLDSIPRSLPALMQSQEMSVRAARFGFEWDTVDQVWEKVAEESQEFVNEPRGSEEAKMEFGDLLFTLVNVARFEGIDAEEALAASNAKFRARWESVERTAFEWGRAPETLSPLEFDLLWKHAKSEEDLGAMLQSHELDNRRGAAVGLGSRRPGLSAGAAAEDGRRSRR